MVDPGSLPPPAPLPRESWLQRLGNRAIDASDSEEIRLRKSLLLFATGLMNFTAALWGGIYWLTGQTIPNSLPLGFQVCSALLLVYYFSTRNFVVYRFLQLALFLVVPFIIQWEIGSFVSSSGIVLLALLAPIGAMVVYGHRESIRWFVAYAVMMALSGAYDYLRADGNSDDIPLKTVALFFVLNFTILSTMVFLLLRYFVKQKDQFQRELFSQHSLLQAERAKSEALISSMLPAHIAERLKNHQSSIADGYADITVMFADLANFTELAEALSPGEVVSFLNEVFTRLDQLAIRHRLDKIKTIGDAYMVVGGLASDRGAQADAVAEMAIAIQEMARTDPLFLRHCTMFHIGIATGPAVAAVIGTTRLSYDVWGDTVNVAARLTGEAASGTIEVDRATFRRLARRYRFGEARKVVFKGKGETAVYGLLGRRPEVEPSAEPVETFSNRA